MSSSFEHPSLKMALTPEQRDRAEQWLQQAYAEGRISEDEFDWRIGKVLQADTRRELNQAFYGLVQAHPLAFPGGSPGSTLQPVPRAGGQAAGAIAHFSGLFTWIVGPGLVYAMSAPGTVSRREAAKAFNFQLISALAFVAGMVLTAIIPGDGPGWILGLLWLGWLILTIVGGVKAAHGQNWRNPVKSVIKLDVLPER